jgi:tetratricopeptide (TPR) repeat protein
MHIPRNGRPRPAAVLALAALAACAVYANALRNGYALDDAFILRDNPAVHGLGSLRAVLLGAWWPGTNEMYRPVTLLSFAVEWALFGDAPAWFHAASVLLHAGASALAAGLVLRLGGGRAAALGAGLLFAVHPVHVEAVSNLVGRAEVLATLGVLAACHLYLARRVGAGARLAGVAVLYLLALGAKESAAVLPALLLVVDALRTRDEGTGPLRLLRRNALLLGVLALCLAGYLALRQQVLGGFGTDPAPYLRGISTADRLATAVRLWPEYVRLMLFPRDLSAEWGPDALRPATWGEPMVWLGLLLGMGLAAAAWRSWRGDRWVAAAVLWFAFSVLPVSQLLFPVGVLLAERTLYLPSAALVFLLPPLAAFVRRREEWVRPAVLAGGVALALLAARTWARTPSWESTNAVFSQMVADHPEVWFVEWQAGELLVRGGRAEEALPWYEKAAEKVDRNHPGMNVAYASILLDLGRADEAEPLLRRTLALEPGLAPARQHLASVLLQRGRHREALALLDRAALAGADAATRERMEHRRALAYDGLGRADSALAVREAALRAARGGASGPAWYHYARLLALRGRMDEARAAADSARGRFPPAYRSRVTVDPIPPLDEPLLRGWGRLAAQPPASASSVPMRREP